MRRGEERRERGEEGRQEAEVWEGQQQGTLPRVAGLLVWRLWPVRRCAGVQVLVGTGVRGAGGWLQGVESGW